MPLQPRDLHDYETIGIKLRETYAIQLAGLKGVTLEDLAKAASEIRDLQSLEMEASRVKQECSRLLDELDELEEQGQENSLEYQTKWDLYQKTDGLYKEISREAHNRRYPRMD